MSEQQKPDAIAILEAELGETLKAVSESFDELRNAQLSKDEYGYKRSSAVSDAVRLLQVSAELGVAIAKIKGQYNHNINVLRGEIWPPPRRAVSKPETFEQGRPTAEAVAEALEANLGGIPGGTPFQEK